MPDMRIGRRRLGSHNALLKTFPGADGLKTGFTCDSGYNVVASATRDGRRLMAVVLGETSGNERAIRAASLLEYGFQSYGWKELFNTTNVDNLPLDPAAKGITSVRDMVTAWECGGHRRHKAGALANRKALKAKIAASKAKTGAKKKGETSDARPALKGTVTGTSPSSQIRSHRNPRKLLRREAVNFLSNDQIERSLIEDAARRLRRAWRRGAVRVPLAVRRRRRCEPAPADLLRDPFGIRARLVFFRRIGLSKSRSGTMNRATGVEARRSCAGKSGKASPAASAAATRGFITVLCQIRGRKRPSATATSQLTKIEELGQGVAPHCGAKLAFPNSVNLDLSLE